MVYKRFQVRCSVKSQTVYIKCTHKAVQTTPTDQAKTASAERGIQADPIW